ncbi:MAG: dTDP-4-dehydrorhamnose 3,5-epimerase [Burkholderiaceae bacterium]|nr:dTDP-4-dehydrorhamnose 3,5-epimerase [Burkholderiaceae bacterium]
MKLVPTTIPDVHVIEPDVFADERGWFMESFNEARWRAAFAESGLAAPPAFVQDNHSCSRRGVLRGLHFQRPPYAQGKLVRVVQGAAFDVAVDIRAGSPNFGRWVGTELNATNRRQMWIPEGFAHGFLTLADETHFLYKTTNYYDRASEGAILWSDPDLAITWPGDHASFLLNAKDALAPPLRAAVV